MSYTWSERPPLLLRNHPGNEIFSHSFKYDSLNPCSSSPRVWPVSSLINHPFWAYLTSWSYGLLPIHEHRLARLLPIHEHRLAQLDHSNWSLQKLNWCLAHLLLNETNTSHSFPNYKTCRSSKTAQIVVMPLALVEDTLYLRIRTPKCQAVSMITLL